MVLNLTYLKQFVIVECLRKEASSTSLSKMYNMPQIMFNDLNNVGKNSWNQLIMTKFTEKQ